VNPAIFDIALSSAVAGTLDIASALQLAKRRGMSARTLLQFVASGALGPSAFKDGIATAIAGLGFHYLISTLWAAAYFGLSRQCLELLRHPAIFGALYGILVHLVMSFVVLPLSRCDRRPFALQPWLIQLGVHIVCVGLPIALVQNELNGLWF
jgi:hypothetical protein